MVPGRLERPYRLADGPRRALPVKQRDRTSAGNLSRPPSLGRCHCLRWHSAPWLTPSPHGDLPRTRRDSPAHVTCGVRRARPTAPQLLDQVPSSALVVAGPDSNRRLPPCGGRWIHPHLSSRASPSMRPIRPSAFGDSLPLHCNDPGWTDPVKQRGDDGIRTRAVPRPYGPSRLLYH